MEFLLVHYDRRRTVYVNGKKAGFPKRPFRIGAGRQRVDLGERMPAKSRRNPTTSGPGRADYARL